MIKRVDLTGVFQYWKDGLFYVGRLVGLPIFSQGKTVEELEDNIREAYQLMMNQSSHENEVTTNEILRLLHVSKRTIFYWIRAGMLHPLIRGRKGSLKFDVGEVFKVKYDRDRRKKRFRKNYRDEKIASLEAEILELKSHIPSRDDEG